jgi:hypothetical protein
MKVTLASLGVAGTTYIATPQITAAWEQTTQTPEERRQIQQGAYYPNCGSARAAGAAPIDRGEPGYRVELDRDEDGVACEPYL